MMSSMNICARCGAAYSVPGVHSCRRPQSDLSVDAWKAACASAPQACLACASRDNEITTLRADLARVTQERDAAYAQLRGTGHVPYLDRMRELVARAERAEATLQQVIQERDGWKDAADAMHADYLRMRERAERAEATLQAQEDAQRRAFMAGWTAADALAGLEADPEAIAQLQAEGELAYTGYREILRKNATTPPAEDLPPAPTPAQEAT